MNTMSPGLMMRSEKLRQFGQVFGPEETITSSTSSIPGIRYRNSMMWAVTWFSVRPGRRNFMVSQCAASPMAPTTRIASCSSSFFTARASIIGVMPSVQWMLESWKICSMLMSMKSTPSFWPATP